MTAIVRVKVFYIVKMYFNFIVVSVFFVIA